MGIPDAAAAAAVPRPLFLTLTLTLLLLLLSTSAQAQGVDDDGTPDPFAVWGLTLATTPDGQANYSFIVVVRRDLDPYTCSAVVPIPSPSGDGSGTSGQQPLPDVPFTHCTDPYNLVFFAFTRHSSSSSSSGTPPDGEAGTGGDYYDLYIQSDFSSHCCGCPSCGTQATYAIPAAEVFWEVEAGGAAASNGTAEGGLVGAGPPVQRYVGPSEFELQATMMGLLSM